MGLRSLPDGYAEVSFGLSERSIYMSHIALHCTYTFLVDYVPFTCVFVILDYLLSLSLYPVLDILVLLSVLLYCCYLFRGGVWGLRDIPVRLEYGWIRGLVLV